MIYCGRAEAGAKESYFGVHSPRYARRNRILWPSTPHALATIPIRQTEPKRLPAAHRPNSSRDDGKHILPLPAEQVPMRRAVQIFLLLLIALVSAPLWASDQLALGLGDLQGPGWRAQNVRATLDLHRGGTRIAIERLELPAPVGTLHALNLSCGSSRFSGPIFSCDDGRFRLRHPALAEREFRGDFSLHRASGEIAFQLHGLPLAAGKLDIEGRGRDKRWTFTGTGTGLALAQLRTLLGSSTTLPANLSGTTSGKFDLALIDGALQGSLGLQLRQLQLADEAGRLATEALDLDLDADLKQAGTGWRFRARISAERGQFYAEPVFVDAGEHPFKLDLHGRWDDGTLDLTEFRLRQPSAADAQGYLRYSAAGGLQDAGMFLRESRLAGLYELYLKPFLLGTGLDELSADGVLRGELRLRDGAPSRVDLRLDQGTLEAGDRFALRGLAGNIDWQAEPSSSRPLSRLGWQSGHIQGITLGPASLPLRLGGSDLALLEPTRIPLLDGALTLNELQAQALTTPQMSLTLDARLAPIDMRRISTALGWPPLSGTLAGRLPTLHYTAGELSLDGPLQIEAFGGRIALEQLRLRDPFGELPRLSADVRLRELDLRTVTDTFSFGRIEGRLDGDIERLRLIGWRPTAFDARFYSSPGDRSRRRISQRAIENLSSIGGGGAGAVLSRGFMKFFEDFSYDRIGLSCRLRDDVCLMGGLAPAREEPGYYIVRGRLLPRVDVIGHQRQVSWSTLLEQLKSARASEGPVIQ
jgi:hypothetical protein